MSQFGGFNIDDIIKRFITDSDDAKAASLAQLDQLMNTIKQLGIQTGATFDEALGGISSAGQTASADETRRGQQTFAAGRQDLISSGLSNTTLGPNLRRAVDDDVSRRQQGIQEGVNAQRSDLLTRRAGQETQIGGMLANAIQGVNNIGPDFGQFASLIAAASQASDPNKKVTANIGPGSIGASSFGIRANAKEQQAAANARQLSGAGAARTVSKGGGGGGAGGSQPSAGGGDGGGGGGSGSGARIIQGAGGRGATAGSAFGAQGQQLNPQGGSLAERLRRNRAGFGGGFFSL
jgi:hypothetical protein